MTYLFKAVEMAFRISSCLFLIGSVLCINNVKANAIRDVATPNTTLRDPPKLSKNGGNSTSLDVGEFCKILNDSARNALCESADATVCAMRFVTKGESIERERRTFRNWCYLAISNLCDHPDNEFSILYGADCDTYLARRRTELANLNVTAEDNSTTAKSSNVFKNITTVRPDAKKGNKKLIRTEPVPPKDPLVIPNDYDGNYSDYAPDAHLCPLSCTETYAPQCFTVNKGKGKYMKLFRFNNHCFGDLYFCTHRTEMYPPPDMDINTVRLVASSPLSWSYCAAPSYIIFARFSEGLSSMHHYGWLAGDYKAAHMLLPEERIPGYG